MSQALYDAVKSGQVKLDSLNDAGKNALRSYMSDKANPGGTIDSIHADQHQAEKSVGFTPRPFSMDPVSTYSQSAAPKKSFAETVQDPSFGRNLPLVGGVLENLDRIANSKFAKAVKNIGELGYTPGAGLANVAGLASSAEGAVAKFLPNLISKTGGKVAQKALSEAITGAPLGVGQALAQGQDNGEALKGGLYGAALGGATGALMPFAGAGLGKIGELMKKQAPLPSYDGIGLNSNLSGKPKVVENHPSDYINSFKNLVKTEDIHSGLKEIDGHLSELEAQYTQALDGQYKFLKDSLKNRQGVNQGGMIKDSNGDVIDRFGRTSNNPEWYQKFYKENNRIPTNKDLLNLAQQHVDQGFTDSGVNIPSWKDQTGYEDAKSSLKSVKNELNKSLLEVNSNKPIARILNNPIKPLTTAGKDIPLNVDSATGEPIKLTPKEQEQQARIDQFSKIEQNPILPNTMDQIQSKTIGEPLNFKKIANEAYIKGVDNLHRTNQFDTLATKAKGSDLKPSDQAYTLALNARGQDMQASQIINKNMINAKGEITGQSLADITKQVPKNQEQALNDYEVAKHSISRMGRGESVYANSKDMTIQKAKMIVENYDKTNPEFKDIAAQHTQFHKDFAQQWYVDTGLFKQSQLDAATEANPHYVSNKRIFSDLEKQQQFNSKAGVTGQSNPVKRYDPSGSQRKIVSPFESSIEDVAKGVKTAKWNEAGQAIVRSLQRNPDELSHYAEIIHDHPKLNVDEMIQKDGLDGVIDHLNKSFEDATRNYNKDTGNVVTVLVHGEPVHIRVHDPQFLEAISNLSPKGQDYVTAAVGSATKVMKNLTTGINPVFGLTRNIFRDIPHGFVSSKSTSNPAKYAYDLVGSLISVMKNGKLYNEYKNMGGGHSSPTASDRNLLAQSKEKILPSSGIKQTLKRNLITRPYHMLENINNAAEAAPRLAEFKRQTQLGEKQGLSQYDAKVKALYEANDLTTNFNKFGNVTKNADAYLPYLNAAVQGLDQVTRLYTKGGPKRLAQVYAKSIGAITIPSVVTYLLYHNDPDYQQVSNFTKDNYLLVGKNADGTFNKVAKPRELGMVFGTAVERVLRQFNDKDPRAFQDFSNNFLKNFLPPGAGGAVEGLNQKGLAGIPGGALQDTIFGPLVDLERNKNFANQPIVPQDLLGLSPRNQYDSKTSEPAKFLGNLINTSPKQLDFLAKSYLGGVAQLGIPATTKGGSIGDTLKQQVTVDPTFSNDLSRNFYDQKAKADMAKADAKFTGIPQQQDMSAYYDKLATQFGKLRNQMKIVQKDDTISNTDKRAKLKELQNSLNIIQKNATK